MTSGVPAFPGRTAAAAASLAAVALLCSCNPASIPKDAEGAFAEAQGGILLVGVVENAPWIIDCSGQAQGVEADLIRGFAHEIGAEVQWVWKPLPQLMRALQNYELHLVVGGVEKDVPWKSKVGLTRPYAQIPLCIGSPAGGPLPEEFDGLKVGIEVGSPAIKALKDHDAEIVYLDDVWSFQGLVVAPAWELDARGYAIHYPALSRSAMVMAAPKGENQLIGRLESYLGGRVDVPQRYQEIVRALQAGRLCGQQAGEQRP